MTASDGNKAGIGAGISVQPPVTTQSPAPVSATEHPVGGPAGSYSGVNTDKANTLRKLTTWIVELRSVDKRENALTELARHRDDDPDLAVLLWSSVFTVEILLQEIIGVYEYINPPVLTPAQSNRACNALALFQCIASHPLTRNDLVDCHIPMFLYPFLRAQDVPYPDSNSKHATQQPLDFVRLTSLGVIGALVKSEDDKGTKFLLDNEYMPMGLSIIENGNELTQIVSSFILLRILSIKQGLEYCCQTYERFSHVAFILGKVVSKLAESLTKGEGDPKQQCKLLNKITRCYTRLCDNTRARKALRECLPSQLKGNFFETILDQVTEQLLVRLRTLVKQDSAIA